MVSTEDWSIVRRAELPVIRPPGVPTPCWKCPKVPASAPMKTRAHAVELSQQNREAYEHYLECRAVGQFPADPIVRRWARIIRQALDDFDRDHLADSVKAMVAFLGVEKRGRHDR